VLGASRGLGRAIAAALADEGAHVTICARDPVRLKNTALEIGAKALVADLNQYGAGKGVVEQVLQAHGELDILVVNTGGPPAGTFDELGDEAWRLAFEGLMLSCISVIRAALPAMRARRHGRILVVTSIAGREPITNLMLSNALRAGLHGLVNALSREVASVGITVNAIAPGYTMTERLAEMGIEEAQVAQDIPAKRMGRPEEVAALATFLASARAGYITGQAIACDGGWLRSI
jgi:3-oxoacyl-[acyl-carrier protein] reductase